MKSIKDTSCKRDVEERTLETASEVMSLANKVYTLALRDHKEWFQSKHLAKALSQREQYKEQ